MLLGFIMGKLGADEEKFVDRLQVETSQDWEGQVCSKR